MAPFASKVGGLPRLTCLLRVRLLRPFLKSPPVTRPCAHARGEDSLIVDTLARETPFLLSVGCLLTLSVGRSVFCLSFCRSVGRFVHTPVGRRFGRLVGWLVRPSVSQSLAPAHLVLFCLLTSAEALSQYRRNCSVFLDRLSGAVGQIDFETYLLQSRSQYQLDHTHHIAFGEPTQGICSSRYHSDGYSIWT